MPAWLEHPYVATLFEGIGICAALIFYGRFYLQWFVSERSKKSVVPIGFWYMSSLGSLMLLSYAAYTRSPVGALSHTFNIVIYARNLIHIWRERGALTRRRSGAVHTFMTLVVLGAVGLLIYTWTQEVEVSRTVAPETVRQNWFWIGIGVAGQALFGCRFLVQWIMTERAKKSIVPPMFWYISLAAAILLFLSFLQRREWIFIFGTASTIPIYARNIWFVRRDRVRDAEEPG